MSACEKAITFSKNLGIDECEIVHVKRKVITVRVTDSEIAELKQNFDENYGIRLIHEKKIASSQTNNEKHIQQIIESAKNTTKHLKPNSFWKSLPYDSVKFTIPETFDKKLTEISGSKATDIAQEMINSASNEKINSISGSLNIVSENFEILNSNGLSIEDLSTYMSGTINADSESGESPVSGIGQHSCRTLDAFTPEKIGNDAKIMCIESINPQKCQEDTYSIIFEPYSVGELLAFVFASNFNLKVFSEKKSCFSNNFGKEIAVNGFNLIDDPHVPQGIGSKSFDDEGTPTEKKYLVKKGIFENTFSDQFNAFKEGKESTGNGLRPGSPMGRSSEPIPISAPHNLRVEPGNESQEDMVKDTKHGLIVGRLWYTYAVNPIKGDFSCTARSGIRIIENGQIKSPSKSVRIIHNLSLLLKNISAIGNNEKNVLQWASLPSIAPSIKIDGIKVNPIS